ncbi:MAG: discoidin domain-containing protein [Candidatus Sumerlaeia bacterium]|nr:discoidin domain-containing protein [Candidatus Sumerlaeia bacterium]
MSETDFCDLDLLLGPEHRGAALLVAQSDLCPALVMQTHAESLRLFDGLEPWGLSGPMHLAVPTDNGIVVKNAGAHAAWVDGARQTEAWLLCWFEGGRGWDRLAYGQPSHWRGRHPERPLPPVDVPWLVVLDRRAKRLRTSKKGLEIIGEPKKPGQHARATIVMMPLFGAQFLLADTTRRWRHGLPDDVIARCRQWSRFLRRVPIGCRETFRLDEQRDVVSIRQTFSYLAIEDAWQTPAEYIAPYPPFALLAAAAGFPLVFEEAPARDKTIPTLYGPYGFRCAAKSAAYELRGLLKYIRCEEAYPDAPCSKAAGRARARLQQMLRNDPQLPAKTSGGYTRGLALALASSARALRYLSENEARPLRAAMRKWIERILDPSQYMPLIRYAFSNAGLPPASARTERHDSLQPVSPVPEPLGEAICQRMRDAYKVVQANFYGLWAAFHTSGNWARANGAWPLMRRWFHLPYQTHWLSPLPARWEGLDIARALFDGTVGYARLAARVGSPNEYRRAACLFAKVCAGWFAMEQMPAFLSAQSPARVNTDADFLIWHPCRLNGYALIANDHLLPADEPEVDGRGWASAYGRITPSCARFWRDHLRERAREVLDGLLARCMPAWAAAGVPVVLRAYAFGESAARIERRRAAEASVEREAASHPLRLRTWRLFQSTPVWKAIAAIEAGARPVAQCVVPPVPPMRRPLEGASVSACRMEQTAMPVRVAWGGADLPDAGAPSCLLFWPGIRTPQKPYTVLDPRLDLLPFGSIAPLRYPAGAKPTADRPLCRVHHPNWCLSLFTSHDAVQSGDGNGRSVGVRPRSAPRINWAAGRPVYVSKRFPFKEFKYAADREQWLAAWRREGKAWNLLRPPHELTDGQGLRPGVEPWLRHAEADPSYVHWIAVDLGRTQLVDEVVVAHDPGWISAGLRVEVWPDDHDWSAKMSDLSDLSARDSSDNFSSPLPRPRWRSLARIARNRKAVVACSFEPVRTRWIRVVFTHPAPIGLSINRIALWEIEVRGPACE